MLFLTKSRNNHSSGENNQAPPPPLYFMETEDLLLCSQDSPQVVTPRQMSQVQAVPPSFLKMHFNIILLHTMSLPFRFYDQMTPFLATENPYCIAFVRQTWEHKHVYVQEGDDVTW
jgi:hypothetical protein